MIFKWLEEMQRVRQIFLYTRHVLNALEFKFGGFYHYTKNNQCVEFKGLSLPILLWNTVY